MKAKTLFLSLMFALCAGCFAQAQQGIIPYPVYVDAKSGSYQLPQKLTVVGMGAMDADMQRVVKQFAQTLSDGMGVQTKTKFSKKVRDAKANQLVCRVESDCSAEGYTLDIRPEGILVGASTAAGFFYALQTLKQMLPAQAAAGLKAPYFLAWSLPCQSIEDHPRYSWRGFMLDEGRHIFGKAEVRRILDIMALYKMNRFHWHLTEDQGWRIEIKKYPKLTEIGAWRTSKSLPWGEYGSDTIHYGGYYTQDDIREIVAYAKERFIEVVPEIDIPGHTQAAVASYPELLACREGEHKVLVGQGVAEDVINVGSPKALQFATDVYDELVELFPFEYIHFGGDECPTTFWEQNAECQAKLKEIGSTKFRDLQTQFYREIQAHIKKQPAEKQRKLVFWNEVLYGNTDGLEDITVMAWVGANAAAKEAAKRGFGVILTPQPEYYINRKQSTDPNEPHTQGKGNETLKKVYGYKPAGDVSADLLPHYKGVQANFWSEWVDNCPLVEYLMLPRLAAVAEAGWVLPEQLQDYDKFLNRVRKHTSIYEAGNYQYGKEAFK